MSVPIQTLRHPALFLGVLLPALLLGNVPTPAAPLRQPAPFHRLTDPVPDPHQAGVPWFPATGHTLRGAFLAYWTRYGGLAQFGYPLTEEFTESNDPDGQNPLQVQYFERTRFEAHPENVGSPYAVLLGPLGRAFHAPDPPVAAPTEPAIHYFAETGHTLQGAFRAYWETHGGLFVHGYPLTEPFSEVNPTDGQTYTVQYFERSRFEDHPEHAGSSYAVLLGLLGRDLTQRLGYFDGTYPRFGHAPDFSWIAGSFAPAKACVAPKCRCPLFNYGESSTYVEPAGPAWEEAHSGGKGFLFYDTEPFILFGHVSTPDQHVEWCPPGYFAEYLQGNF